jgi:transposase
MMGQQAKQTQWWSEPVNVFARIPEDHILRRLNACLDLDFVREEVSSKYGRNGQVSVDPVVLMKMMLLLFLDDVKSERELMRIIPLRLDYLYFLGYGLEDAVPNHSVLSKARGRWGKEVFERLFARTVEQCWKAGLIGGDKVHVDSSLVRADASLNSVIIVERTVAKLEQTEASGEEERPGGDDQKGSGPGQPAQSAVNERHVVATDPEATVVRHRTGKSLPSYKNHRALDDKAGVITACITTTGIRDDGEELLRVLEAHKATTGVKPKKVVGDSKYGTAFNFITLATLGIRTHMADLRKKQNNHRLQGIYGQERFAYDASSDTFTCPAGRKLYNHHYHHQRGYYEYRAGKGICSRCKLAHLCTRAKAGRTVNRYAEQELLDRARSQSRGPSAMRDRKRRQWFQERNFGEAAVQHGFKRARWRGTQKQTIQDQLIAAIQNLKILLRKTGKASRALTSLLQGLYNALRRSITLGIRRVPLIPTYLYQPA